MLLDYVASLNQIHFAFFIWGWDDSVFFYVRVGAEFKLAMAFFHVPTVFD